MIIRDERISRAGFIIVGPLIELPCGVTVILLGKAERVPLRSVSHLRAAYFVLPQILFSPNGRKSASWLKDDA